MLWAIHKGTLLFRMPERSIADELILDHLQCLGLSELADAFHRELLKQKPQVPKFFSRLEKELECLELLRRSVLATAQTNLPVQPQPSTSPLEAPTAEQINLAKQPIIDLEWAALGATGQQPVEDEPALSWDPDSIDQDLTEMKELKVEASSYRVVMRKTAVSRSTFYDSLYPEDHFKKARQQKQQQQKQKQQQQGQAGHLTTASVSTGSLSEMEQRFSDNLHCVETLQKITDTQTRYQQTLTQLDLMLHELATGKAAHGGDEAGDGARAAAAVMDGARGIDLEIEDCLLKILPTQLGFKPFVVSQLPETESTTEPPASQSSVREYEKYSLRVISERGRTGLESCPVFPIVENSVVVNRYRIIRHLGSAAFSRAAAAVDLHTNKQVCLKIIENSKEFLDQSLDEIKMLCYLNKAGDPDKHNVLRLYDYFYHKEHLFLVTELLGENLYEFYRFNSSTGDPLYFNLQRVRLVAQQVLVGLTYTHSLGIIHADLKPENILMCSYSDTRVKIIDFGSSAFVGDALSPYVQSRSYRAPEVILGLPYDQRIDVWSLGCILFEILTGKVLFINDSVQALLVRVMAILGPLPPSLQEAPYSTHFFTQGGQVFERVPSEAGPTAYYHYTPRRTSLYHLLSQYHGEETIALFIHFLSQLLILDPKLRPTAAQALNHPFLTQVPQ